MNINANDLNLLAVFHTLARELNTTKAAKSLGLSQPAVSHALARLRLMFNDPLFVRASRGLTPTLKAKEIMGPIENILKQTESLLREVKFNPAEERRVFKISTTDYFEVVALPRVLRQIARLAPGIQIVTRPTRGQLQKEDFEKGELDLAIAGYFGDLPEGYYQQSIFKDDFVCVGRKGNPTFSGKLTPKKYAGAKHILISPQGDMTSKSARALKKLKFEQDFQAGISSFTAPGWIIAESDLLLTCPRKLAEAYQKYLPIEVARLPFLLEDINVVQVWHARHHKDEAHAWLRNLIKNCCEEI